MVSIKNPVKTKLFFFCHEVKMIYVFCFPEMGFVKHSSCNLKAAYFVLTSNEIGAII